jgi:N-acetylmuramoyl-L-alanine amidase
MLHLHTIVKRLVYPFVLMAWLVVLHNAFAQEPYNYLSFNGQLFDEAGPFYFVTQGDSQNAFVKLDALASKLGYEYSYDGQTLHISNAYRQITLKATNNIVVGLEKRPDVLSVNGSTLIPSPMGIVVGGVAYAAITPIMQAVGGESGWQGAERLIWLRYNPNVDIPKKDEPEVVQANAPPTPTETAGATLGNPRVGAQEGGQTRVVIDLPPNSFYELYAFDRTLIVSLPQLGAAPYSRDFADDPNIENVRYALVDNKLALVITTRYVLSPTGSGYRFALLPADTTTSNERFYVEFSPSLTDDAVKSAQGMQPQELTSMVAQAPGAQRKVVLIDPGHGGEDPGSSHYATEKTVVLSVSLKVKAYLEAYGIQVQMTRSDDTRPTLEERANAATPDINLFVSIHANAGPAQASGIETWIFGEPLNPDLIAQAIRENGGGAEGQARTQEALQIAQGIEGDIFRETQLAYSRSLAELVQGKMVAATGAKDRGVRQNSFYVIRNARSPSILIETGFVSNPDEGSRLATDSYQDTLARAIAEGIAQFLNQGAAVATNP